MNCAYCGKPDAETKVYNLGVRRTPICCDRHCHKLARMEQIMLRVWEREDEKMYMTQLVAAGYYLDETAGERADISLGEHNYGLSTLADLCESRHRCIMRLHEPTLTERLDKLRAAKLREMEQGKKVGSKWTVGIPAPPRLEDSDWFSLEDFNALHAISTGQL